ncbi:MAG: 23S rRNA (uracil(1939)-C(5))-methyltransferase RlmD [Clostridiales bacterium]|nr:23S rRNA (uracil(1939)-C(5))-methyltransferase RlmD [Clostridiales bacterium]
MRFVKRQYPMLRKNDITELDILRFAGARGFAQADGMAVFVENALPGERVRALILKVQKNCAFAKTVEILTPSPDRAEPDCPYYRQCGSCTCRHMTYGATLRMKREDVRDAFAHIAGISIDVPPVIGMEEPAHYRNKVSMPVAGETGAPAAGYYAPRSHRVTPVEDCLISMDSGNAVVKVTLQWMKKFGIPPYDENTGKGLVRHIMARTSRAGESMAVIIAAGKLPHEQELAGMLRAAVPGLCSVQVNLNRRRDNVILGDTCRVIWGRERLRDTLCGLTFDLSPLSFFQINPVQTEKLYQTALDFADLKGSEEAVDLYCGAGTISLNMAKKAKHVTGIEIVPPAIEDAKMNALRNGVANADFYAAAAEDLLPELAEKGLRPDVIMMDPPRKGAEEAVLRAIAKCAPEKVVYVSCDVHSQARDVKLLTALGYRLEKVQPVDMFPWTEHVETVVLLSRLRQKPDDYIDADVDAAELEGTSAETKATYEKI